MPSWPVWAIDGTPLIPMFYGIMMQYFHRGGNGGGDRLIRSLLFLCVLAMAAAGFHGCDGDDSDPEPEKKLRITEVSIPAVIEAEPGGSITLTGKGFAVNDEILLTGLSGGAQSYTCTITGATAANATFTLPVPFTAGSYRLTVSRGGESLQLGTVNIQLVAVSSIPDVAGMTVKGVVSSNGQGVAGVVVSDGIEVTTTDSRGIYYLPSKKKHGYVFLSVPSRFEVAAESGIPLFFKKLTGGSSVERKDFQLLPADNDRYALLAMTDWHLANRNDDLSQFSNGFVPDVNNTIRTFEAAGTRVYGVTMGDLTWDAYWYENKFGPAEYLPQMAKVNCTIFNAMGNHDNDPYVASDWLAEAKYREVIGPTYYSFNLGKLHYVVLDNTEYTNAGGAQGVMGDREYNDVVSPEQMAWLQKDLATVADKTAPLMLIMHIPLFSNPSLDGNGNPVSSITLNNGSQLIGALSAFSEVHILTGHTHINYTVEQGNIMEHNTAAVCATWWWTGKNGYAGNQICKDGSPGGYGVWEIDGKTVKWYYKGIGSPANYQFRSYDLNRVLITAALHAPASTDAALAEYAGPYANPGAANEILINVWGYDPRWKVEVKEAGKALEVRRAAARDPLHIISYEAKRLNAGAVPTSSFVTGTTAHLFKATASSATSTLEITVTDRFGNVSAETMNRPKEFTYLMK